MDDDIPAGSWSIGPEMRRSLRLQRATAAFDGAAYDEAILELEEMLDEVPSDPEALALLGEALLEVGDAELALQALESCRRTYGLLEPPVDLVFSLGLAAFETCDLTQGADHLREVVRREPAHADAHFTLGLLFELRGAPGDSGRAATAFAAAGALAPETYPPPMQLTAADWQTALREAMAHLPSELLVVLDGVPVSLTDRPDLQELRRASPPLPPTVVAMLDGAPGPGDTDHEDEPLAPTGLRIYTRILSRYPTFDDVVSALTQALTTEIADWLGLDDGP